MNEELNKKLAKWAGFSYEKIGQGHRPGFVEFYDWIYPDKTTRPLPNFTESLDACFEWLVPKLEPLGYDLQIDNDLEMLGWSVCLSNTKSGCSIASPMEHCELDGIALALCLAIERLVKK